MAQRNYPNEPVVIVGSGCRFPGAANTPSKLWDLLKEPRDVQSRIPKERFDVDTFYHPDGTHHGRTNASYAYFLKEDLHAFDAPFFNIQAGEAESMDPQQRLLLETVYEAVSNAGMRMQDLQGSSTAVYVGMMTHDYETTSTRDLESIPTYSATGVAVSIASNRISYFFDWHGPSMTIDTACSSSLAAVHLAVQQLRSGQSTMAVAAGANLILGPMTFVLESKLNMLSPSGRSRMWDAGADGYARGEAVCSVVLKTLSQALKDGDTIECVIRETGINQDGRTTGITMPNHDAQEALIRATYARAGLDINNPQERCQFFEAHGTGTPAGDPQEANAIASAFFGQGDNSNAGDDPLFVGSIKTIVGHTEGTAGIAGLLKACLAVQHGVIPPNLLFNKLSPRVAPFYNHLKITTEAIPWPTVAPGQPRRVSVNSFGFGGTNAHAIVEEYLGPDQGTPVAEPAMEAEASCLPLVLSAKSKKSMKSTLESMIQFIDTQQFSLQDLACTLLEERSVLPFRRAIVGNNKETLRLALEAAIEDGEVWTDFSTDTKGKPQVLGIFTGQGAQWPGMLKKLLLGVPYATRIIEELDEALRTLPEKYRPSWTLYDQLMLEGEASNVRQASFSQPLCCAVQIVLVRLLSAAGIQFNAVVGHSSGEIACAFAAGFISAAQAIRIAYLRGVVSAEYASSPSGQPGAMLAAGMSYDDAKELCEMEAFEGRVCVAASNSPDSVTISGDADAIQHVQGVLEDESTFARLLKVDKAYHSHHMLPCAEPYVQLLEECGCAVADANPAQTGLVWYSSVHETNKEMTAEDVTAAYWKDNLVSPVLFSHAVQKAAVTCRGLQVGIEVGCHPALKGPCLATVKDALDGTELLYTGCLERGADDMTAFARGLGFLWERFGVQSIDATGFAKEVSPQQPFQSLAKVLPLYPWDHSRRYWTESRSTREHLRGQHPHLLLGKLSSTASTFQWNNFVRPRDLEWLDGHALQGQTVFPAAGYIVMAMEAAMRVASDNNYEVELLEIVDMDISKAVVFEDDNSLVELNLSASVTSEPGQDGIITLKFFIDSCLSKESELSTSAKGEIIITVADKSSSPAGDDESALPAPEEEHPQMNRVNVGSFYKELDLMGYDYSKDFRCLKTMRRADAKATGTLSFLKLQDAGRGQPLLMHPAPLDIAFQTVIGAYSSPGDRRLRSLYVPTHIDRISLVPSLCLAAAESGADELAFNTTNTYDKGDFLSGDITVFGAEKKTLLQVENIMFKPFSPPTASTDHRIFAKWFWNPLTQDKLLDDPAHWATEQDKQAIPIIERIVYFYIKSFLDKLTSADYDSAAPHFKRQIDWFKHVQNEARNGNDLWYDASWEKDSSAEIQELCESNSYHPHVRLVQRVGENLFSVTCQGQSPFDLMDHDGLLTEFYTNKLSFGPALYYARDLVAQIAHRFQSMDVLEIGAGTGGATKHILSTPQLGLNSYTYTDISTDFFEQARAKFAEFDTEGLMQFESLDIRSSPAEQGFKEHSYDLIIASNVLHATPKLEETMAHARSLLKPGGHMVILEITHREHSRLGFLFGLFPDWWAGVDDGRVLEPFVSYDRWDAILKRVGFSGIESRTLDRDANLFPTSVFSTYAADSRIDALHNPLSAPLKTSYPPLVVVGGKSPETRRIMEELTGILPHRSVQSIASLDELASADLQPKSTFVVLSEIDDEIFAHLDEDKFEAAKNLLFLAGKMLWLTESAWIDNPHQASTIGMLRSIAREHPDRGLTLIDVDSAKDLDTKFLVEQLLRLEDSDDDFTAASTWTDEPEVYWCKGRAWIPRLKHDKARNDRMNSSRRPVLGDFDPAQTPVALKQTKPSAYYLEGAETFPGLGDTQKADNTTVRVRYALSQAIRVSHLGFFHLVQGTTLDGASVVALSEQNASIVHVPQNHVFAAPSNVADKDPGEFLMSVAATLIGEAISREAQDSGPAASVLVFEPPSFCIGILLEEAERRGFQICFATTSPSLKSTSSPAGSARWIILHGKETDGRLKQIRPANLTAFFDMSTNQTAVSIGHRLANVLPPSCYKYGCDYIVRSTASSSSRSSPQEASVVEQSIAAAAGRTIGNEVYQVFPASQLSGSTDKRLELSTLVDWKTEKPLSAKIRPVDSANLFVDNKTYLLVGLTGDLGRSLARWMILHGAKYVVLTSRNPRVDPRWIAHVEALGGKVTVLPMDVANKESVDAGFAKLQDLKLPPTAGIAFGPLVLQDVMLKNMDLQSMTMVLEPKVRGAQILHERFSNPASSNPLDFFVMFSSIVAVMGNPGQANYSAANSYLQALAQQRLSKGLAGSTIDIGAVYGVGFVTRAELEEDFNAIRFMFDSVEEHELHTLFAEAVVSGKQALARFQNEEKRERTVIEMADVELTTGIPALDPALKDRITFFNDARVGNFKIPEQRKDAAEGAGAKGSVKEQLQQATTLGQVRQIVIDNLSAKLRVTLQIADGESLHPDVPLIDQGVDSLGAVTVGSWFSKQLLLDLPLLKVLSGASVADLADDAAARLPASAIPLVNQGEETTADSSDDTRSNTATNETSAETPLTGSVDSLSDDEADKFDDDDGSVVVRHEKMSLAQEYSWKVQQGIENPTVFNNTIGMFMKGAIDLERFSRSLKTVMRRYEIFRTAFDQGDSDDSDSDKIPQQTVLKHTNNKVQILQVSDRAAAEEVYQKLHETKYDIAGGDTLRLVDCHWGNDEHLLIVAYHRLVGDGSTTENLFVEAAKLYSDVPLKQPTVQFADLAAQQRKDLEEGRLDEDISFWSSMHSKSSASAPLPLMQSLTSDDAASSQESKGAAGIWHQHQAIGRLDPMVAFRIKDRSRKHKATPMQFYLAAYHVLLSRMTGSDDIAIGIADTNRSTMDELSAMGFFANLLPLRFGEFTSSNTFGEHLVSVKDSVREALKHSRVPYGVVHDRLGSDLPTASTGAPLFQAVFDYKQGQAESGAIGDAVMTEVIAARERTPYDVVLEMSDDPTKDPLITVKLQGSKYSPQGSRAFLDNYISLLSMFSMNPALKLA
ncbi:Putative Acyl transferase domain superfamily, Condensation domain, ancestral KRAB domain, thiolase [Colletotrichum destructivum]|uniref:Acyl transferase domain superfamily, Condensation domain, ancestral KRAB domain, thiolase n=1 Tax=Colletotrichum destructivum TaxID=34406 RepID=A0AAX4IFG2_9PEZI|nr:Putative Acyl transferase domain superfamily, Condensation domain, ancestral KRAB domain, thiolase [Colletotrichum destructivum]